MDHLRQIDRQIAEKLGWRIVEDPDPRWETFVTVFDETGKQRGHMDNGHWTFRFHKSDIKVLPAVSSDANLQLEICTTRGWSLWFEVVEDGIKATCVRPMPDGMVWSVVAETAQLAGALAIRDALG